MSQADLPLAPPATPPLAPPLAGRYVVLDLLGVGGMGSVWRAWDLREARFVALKLLHRFDAEHLLRFVREQGVRIDHPHVATPTGWAADDDQVAFSMALARGGSVLELQAEHGLLAEPFAVELLDQLLQGLVAVHAAGVVHRDLKPANLLLDATGRGRPHLRIGDFGVAAAASDGATSAADAVGTDGYAAPEQVQGTAPDPRQDLYAVGVIGLELLGPAAGPPGRLRELLAALCSIDPGRRPETAHEALGLLRGCAVLWRPSPEHPVVRDRLGAVAVPVPAALRPPHIGRARGPSVEIVTLVVVACLAVTVLLLATFG